MKNFSDKSKIAFTLMEIGLSLLIISILVILCIPVVVNQAKKTDEYSYFTAYKTVEKMGAQIVAFGDPGTEVEVENQTGNLKNNKFASSASVYLSLLSKVLTPKANAAIHTSEIVSFPSYEYDYVRLCLGNQHVIKENQAYAGMLYNAQEIATIQSQTLCSNLYNRNDFISKRFMCPNMSITDVREMLSTTGYSASEYCTWLAARCSNAYKCDSDKKSCYRYLKLKQEYWECIITINDPDLNYTPPSLVSVSDDTISNDVSCDRYGYTNMTSAGDVLNCTCDATHPVKALNNQNVCCAEPESGYYPYYASSTSPCVNCKLGAFNEQQKNCCPDNSVYSPSLGKCVCSEGYTLDGNVCRVAGNNCPAGLHLLNNVCVSNPPIIKAKRLCELIRYNWNVSTYSCDSFKDQNGEGMEYNKALYDAITANNTPYLSAKAVEGAFRDIEPNIVFANGLMMWILGDKAASISGLSYNPDGYVPNVNVCALHEDLNSDNCKGGTNFYCKTDQKCFSINSTGSDEDNTPKLKDARNCCSTTDTSDYINLYAGNDYLRDPRTYAVPGFTVFIDINGTKDNDELGGGGTMWKDVFPFFVSSNGRVYPAFPLNAAKASGSQKDSSALFQGGNSSALSADVFYYDVVNEKRKKVTAFPAIPYARALCLSMEISAYTPYCQNLGSKYRDSQTPVDKYIYSDRNPCYKHRCTVKLKNKIKFL